MRAYYNEFDPNAAAWLRELIKRGLITDGVVDERSITEVKPDDLLGFWRVHLFAGIAGWDHALNLAGWSGPVWTGSCPCQPFSCCGKQQGERDERHLWPAFFDLIKQCKPVAVFGEQVADAIGKGWLDGVSTDLEGEGYSCGAAVLGAHSVSSPHRRRRLYWVADNVSAGLEGHAWHGDDWNQSGRNNAHQVRSVAEGCQAGRMAGSELARRKAAGSGSEEHAGRESEPRQPSCWSDSVWHLCRDGKRRRIPTQSEIQPLADGLQYKLARRGSVRPALLKGAGNAIVPQVASEFIQSYMDVLNGL